MGIATTPRILVLDALRGIAALLVVFFHFTMGRSEYNSFFKLGTTGVDLFFMISGFVIFMSLQRVTSCTEFIVNRVTRLYPTYWAAVTFTFVLMAVSSLYTVGGIPWKLPGRYLGNLTMFQLYLTISDLDGPYWTMIVEMLFYIGMVFLYRFDLLKFIVGIGILLSLGAAGSAAVFHDTLFLKSLFFWCPLLPFIPLFVSGIVLYSLYANRRRPFFRYGVLWFCFILQLSLFASAGRASSVISFPEYALMLTLFFTLFVAFVNGRLGFIVNRYTLFLGKISFALYLIHQYVSLTFIIPFLTGWLHMNFWVATIGINLPIIIGIATLITFWVEIPLGGKMKEKLREIFVLPTAAR